MDFSWECVAITEFAAIFGPFWFIVGVALDQFLFFLIISIVKNKGMHVPKIHGCKRFILASLFLTIELVKEHKRSKRIANNGPEMVEDGWAHLAAISLAMHDQLTPQPSPGPGRTVLEMRTAPIPGSENTMVNLNINVEVPPPRTLIARVIGWIFGY